MAIIIGRVAPFPRGAHSLLEEYERLDWVTDSGDSYLYINPDNSTGTALNNATYWLKIAGKGDIGNTGATAYEQAVIGGYTGTLEAFYVDLAGYEGAYAAQLAAETAETNAETARDLSQGYASDAADSAASNSPLWKKTASGNPVSVYPVPSSPLYPKVTGTYTQAAGTPAPDNVIPIVPWLVSAASVNVAITGGNDIDITAPAEIAEGWLDNEGHGQATLKILPITNDLISSAPESAGYTNIVYAAIAKPVDSASLGNGNTTFTLLCDREEKSQNSIGWDNVGKIGQIVQDASYDNFWIGFAKGTSLATMQAALNGGQILYDLATPATLTPTAAPLTALAQVDRVTPRLNILTADSGNIELTYAEVPETEKTIMCIGDSITQSVYATIAANRYPNLLGTMLGGPYNVKNSGVSGATMANIMGRIGAAPIFLNVDIVFGSGVTSITTVDQSVFKCAYPTFASPLNSGLINFSGFPNLNPCYIDGHECEITIAQTGPTLTLTLLDATGGVTLHSGSVIRFNAGNDANNSVVIVMMGTNGDYSSAADYVAQHQKIADYCSHGKYLFLSQFDVHFTGDGTYATYAAAQAAGLVALQANEAAMREAFGNRFINMREALVNHGLEYAIEGGYLTASALSEANNIDAISEGYVPYGDDFVENPNNYHDGLLFDTHPNDAGNYAIAKIVYKELVAMGYVTPGE